MADGILKHFNYFQFLNLNQFFVQLVSSCFFNSAIIFDIVFIWFAFIYQIRFARYRSIDVKLKL